MVKLFFIGGDIGYLKSDIKGKPGRGGKVGKGGASFGMVNFYHGDTEGMEGHGEEIRYLKFENR